MEHVLMFTERSAHTAYFECNLDLAGYVIVNLPVEEWKEMGCPRKMVFSLTPMIVEEQVEKVVAV